MSRTLLFISSFLPFAAALRAQSGTVLFNAGTILVNGTLYANGHVQAEGQSRIFQKGRTIIVGDLINNVTSGGVFADADADNPGSVEFTGRAPQLIRGTASKASNPIRFPAKLVINNQSTDGSVTLKASNSATARSIDVLRGRLVLDSEPVAGKRESIHAHLLAEGPVTNGIQVNLALGDNSRYGRLSGFASPFEKLYADYFFFNFLARPDNVGLLGQSQRLITYPRTLLEPGAGYIVGMGIIPDGDPYYTSGLDSRWKDAKAENRAKDMFRFNRAIAEPSFSQYMNEAGAPGYITGEKLNTSDVKLSLRSGFNYLGNPYVAPLDLSDIVLQNNLGDWGVAPNDLKNGFYVLVNGTGTTTDKQTFTFSVSYLKRQAVGSTYDSDLIAPMQLFVVGTDKDLFLTIPKSRRRHETLSYLRSTPIKPLDEILIETIDHDSQAFDRLCIVLRPDASANGNDYYDAPKIFNRSGGVNQIYTRSADERNLSISVVPTNTHDIPLYFEPAAIPQQVTLKAGRLESLASINSLTLEDGKTGRTINLLKTHEYTFLAAPTDSPERFTLHLSGQTLETEARQGNTPHAVYANGLIQINGLAETELHEHIRLFNAQGQLLGEERIANIPSATLRHALPQGIYFLKTSRRTIKLSVQL
ncbi:MAG: hypothetical protein LBH04_00345 [Tannerellaceae bacterium]|jgi:hypothetical protein|nr:hypothetical protein [Tannerellaceae bacterium]